MGKSAHFNQLLNYCLTPNNRSTIRLTLENVSPIAVDFLHCAFEDSTIVPAQKALAEGNLSVFETYETENSLINNPVFSWDQDEVKVIARNQNLTLTLGCFGKVGWYVRYTCLDIVD
jgi:hypothetical protein